MAASGSRRSRRQLRQETTPAVTSRAGRDLRAATVVGVALLAALAASLFIRPEGFLIFAILGTTGALWEFSQAVATRGIRVPLLPLWVGNIGVLVSAFVAGPEAMVMGFILTAGGVFVWRVVDGGGVAAVTDAATAVFGSAYISLLAGFAILLLTQDRGPLLVVTFILCAVANDVGGYAAGVLFGRHAMAPSISPKKSWEGFAGSLLLAAVVGTVMLGVVLDAEWWSGLIVGGVIVVVATLGDLAESLLKRDLGLKDMGTLLPGHGGIMDRLDSLLMAAPAGYLLLTTFVR